MSQNMYEINGEITTLTITKQDGRTFKALIDTEDLAKVRQRQWSYHRYVYGTMMISRGEKTNISLHRHLLGLSRHDSKLVDHINRNPLDNRKANLRVTTSSVNNLNRETKNLKHKDGRWTVYISGKSWGTFRDKDEASTLAAEIKQKLIGGQDVSEYSNKVRRHSIENRRLGKSGERHIVWDKPHSKWRVTIAGMSVGRFVDLNDAKEARNRAYESLEWRDV
jgi:hypothetical protein